MAPGKGAQHSSCNTTGSTAARRAASLAPCCQEECLGVCCLVWRVRASVPAAACCAGWLALDGGLGEMPAAPSPAWAAAWLVNGSQQYARESSNACSTALWDCSPQQSRHRLVAVCLPAGAYRQPCPPTTYPPKPPPPLPPLRTQDATTRRACDFSCRQHQHHASAPPTNPHPAPRPPSRSTLTHSITSSTRR